MSRTEPQLEPAAPAPAVPAPAIPAPIAAPPAAPVARKRRRGPNLVVVVWRTLVLGVLAIVVAPLLAILALRWLPPPTTAFMLQSPKKPVSYHWVPAAQIAETARKAVVASEDQKFWTHDGFDMEAIGKALEHNKKSRRKRGASTISQQTAKNLFLWPGGGYLRKGVEAGFTVLMERLWSKQRILEVYLNIAEFGPGIYGVEAASQAYFGKPAARLSADESARLAAVLPSPRHWSVRAPGPYVQLRASWILRQMGYGHAAPDEPEPVAPEEGPEMALPEPGAPTPVAPLEPELEAPQPVPIEPEAQKAPALPAAPAPAEPDAAAEPTPVPAP
ncbi:MAG TPA: monofunctional biosynthetic peptidoglycan transglycosylase [Solimonas sp.]|nr:monofunctional biosynthetic peptidoglycan transglycosylase [Solimonas sp.]